MLSAIETALNKPDLWRKDANEWFLKVADNQEQYRALRLLFSTLAAQPIDKEAILIGTLAVYGWMPLMMPTNTVHADAEVTLERILTGKTARSGQFFFLRSRSATTKFLHFLAPTRYFICDSRVKNALDWPSITMNRYLDYCTALSSPEAKDIAAEILRKFPHALRADPEFSAGRAIEAALFCIGSSDRENAVKPR